MKRTAFTMIEMIFVIVILGILAAVALPRFAAIQDDANVAAEKSMIGAIRTGVYVVRGKALTNMGRDVNITITDALGSSYFVSLGQANSPAAAKQEGNISTSGYPNSLSLSAWPAGGGGSPIVGAVYMPFANLQRTSGAIDAVRGSPACVIALEPEGRDRLTTFDTIARANLSATITDAREIAPGGGEGGATTIILGQATKTISDPAAELCRGKAWLYNSVSGNIVIVGKCD